MLFLKDVKLILECNPTLEKQVDFFERRHLLCQTVVRKVIRKIFTKLLKETICVSDLA